jgi:two-component system chemotaxis sensor kinase CheA
MGAMAPHSEKINTCLEKMALEAVTLDKGDIPALAQIMKGICEVEQECDSIGETIFTKLALAVKAYVERLILGEVEDIDLLGEGIGCLQSVSRDLDRQRECSHDFSSVLKRLGATDGDALESRVAGYEGSSVSDSNDNVVSEPPASQALSDEDRQIISDFITESLESLSTIEVSLIDLEQDPQDLETINSIFRPFHTIKGVSGFLNFQRINKLAHSSENLLDKARNGEIGIDETVVDIILEAVDTLKRMILGVQDRLANGAASDDGIDFDPLLEKIENAHSGSGDEAVKPLGEILVHKGLLDKQRLDAGLDDQKKKPRKKIGTILIEKGDVQSKEVISALRDQRKQSTALDLQVKVDTRKLDTLVDMTGELVIAHSMLRQNERVLSATDQKLDQTLNQLTQIITTLQRTAMSMRMVPIKSTFQKMVRLVRDLSKNAGKEVGLAMSGEDTEIDRNVVDELYEPMVHMIRNAVDHGIELPDERIAAGKDRKGTIELRAHHRGGNIVIEIEDNGRGLNRQRILEKAKSLDLIGEEGKLSDAEIFNLIFRPGFSTAKKVTDISGRGVGMDVVKKAIEKLRGRVEINSRPGQGSTFVITLPLTLAIIEGMVVRVGKERYVIPALSILESFRPEKGQYATVQGKGEMIMVRGKLDPLIRLDRLFGVEGDFSDPWDGLVVAVEHEDRQLCLMLDELLGKEEVVIKSLGESLKHIKGLAGGAIMGDGRVGLILDIAGIFEIAQSDGVPAV